MSRIPNFLAALCSLWPSGCATAPEIPPSVVSGHIFTPGVSRPGLAGAGGVVWGLLVILMLAGTTPVWAKQHGEPVRIGALTTAGGPTPHVTGLRHGLMALGYLEDLDFTIGVRFTQGEIASLPGAARALVDFGVDIIFCIGDIAAKAAQLATDRIPIIFVGVNDPVGTGLVKSYARPGGNITGFTDLDLSLGGKRLQMFQQLIPSLKRVLFAYNGGNTYAVTKAEHYRRAAQRLGIELVERPVYTREEASKVLYGLSAGGVDGILSPRNPDLNIMGFILEATTKHGIPTMWAEEFMVDLGGFASYGSSSYESGRLTARMVDKIVKGANPSEIPVEVDPNIILTVNLKVAKAMKISVPPVMLYQAGRIIR